eukprot:757936-Hanusia_phi.AAC.1
MILKQSHEVKQRRQQSEQGKQATTGESAQAQSSTEGSSSSHQQVGLFDSVQTSLSNDSPGAVGRKLSAGSQKRSRGGDESPQAGDAPEKKTRAFHLSQDIQLAKLVGMDPNVCL